MADFSMYHTLGQSDQDELNQQIQTQPAAPQFNPPVAPPPSGYQQNVHYYGSTHPAQPTPYATQTPPPPPPGAVYPPQEFSGHGSDAMGGLAAQMGGLGISGDTGSTGRLQKKKHRHAYHDLGTPAAASQPIGGIPHSEVQSQPQFLNTGLNQQPRPVSPFPGPGASNLQIPRPPQQATFGSSPQPSFSTPGDGSVQTQGKVDPEQIPGIPSSRDIPAQYYLSHVYPTMERHNPPPAAIPFIAHDQGNSSPKFARLTLNSVPSSAEFLSSSALPLGLILQPLASLEAGEQSVPVLDFGEAGPPRCRRCRAYINPFMVFGAGGNKFICNMCTFPNDVPPEYFSPLEPSGVRVDRIQRPELMVGTVEYLVPKEYWVKEPVGLRWLFLIDVSQEAVNKGYLEACCEGIMAALYSDDDDNDDGVEEDSAASKRLPKGSRVGIITFDKEVHFYNLSVRFPLSYA